MLKKIIPLFLIAASFFALTTKSAFALVGGCVNSPEDPTVVMALLGGAAALTPLLWSRVRSRRRPK